MDVDEQQPIAGPSRLSPQPTSPRIPLDADVEMEEQQAMSRSLLALAAAESINEMASGSQSQEAAELLLGFSAIEPRHDDIPTLDPPSPGIPHTGMEPPRLLGHPHPDNSYPYTPPDFPRANGDTPSITTSQPHSTNFLQPVLASSPAPPTSPEAGPSKPKQKRKRTATSSNRRTSTDPARPPHFMGEDNEIIRCICGIDEDDGLTIQCESCYAWQHGQCFGYNDAESAPEIYYCELCSPRPYDAALAREIQIDARDRRREREAAGLGLGPPPMVPPPIPLPALGPEKPKSRAKGKRARVGSVQDGEERGEKDLSPGGSMAPPIAKPRRKPGPKPKSKPAASTPLESTPAPSYYPPAAAPTPVAAVEAEDDYFRIEPWTLEYTPVRDNIVRGRETRRIMGKMYREWVDAEEDEEAQSTANKRRAMAGPSGLPSPTETGLMRFTPDNIFPSPDFSTLAPPVPFATLLGPDLASLGHPISVKSISHALSFLPLSYSDATPLAGPFTGPALYGVFATGPIPASSFIGEFRAEVIDCETYRKDPVNQYDVLGITKPHVHPVGPPVNLMLDSRGYGCELRFIRPGCHPNVVLRPLLFRTSEVEPPKLRFGIFASGDIAKNAELVLGWAWDDQHIVHALRSLIHPTVLADGFPGRPSFAPSLPSTSSVVQSLLDKFEVVLTHLLGTFSSCACNSLGNCAVAQMRYLVEQRNDEHSRAGRRGQRAELGTLVGAVRGWRRREEEVEAVRKWNLPTDVQGPVWGEDEPAEEDIGGEVEVESRGDDARRKKAVSVERSASEAITEMEEEDAAADDEDEMEVDDDEDDGEDEQDRSRAATSPSALTAPSRQASRSESPLTSSPRPSTPRAPTRSPRPIAVAPSSALSSAPRTRPAAPVSDDEALSDATTATIPRASTDEEDDSDADSDSRPKANGAGGRKRRVLSPVAEQNLPSPKREAGSKVPRIRKDGKEDKRFKSRESAGASNKRGRNRIMSSPVTEDDSMDLPGRRRDKEGMASSLFPEDNKEDVMADQGDVEMEEQEEKVVVERIPTPPLPPPAPVKLPTPPPPEPPKKVSISDYLKNRKIQKKSTTDVGSTSLPNGDSAADASGIPASTSSFSVPSDTKSDIPGFNMHDFLPSSRPAAQAPTPAPPISTFGTSQMYESPRPTPTPTSYTPRSEYFPLTTAATPAAGAPAFQPRSQSSYTPRGGTSLELQSPAPAPPAPLPTYLPRGQSTPTDDQQPKPLPVVDDLPNGRDFGYGRYGNAIPAPSRSVSSSSAGQADPPAAPTPASRARQRSASESPVKTSVPLPEQTTSMPPPLPYREPPPHINHFRTFASASLSPEARTSGLPPYRSPIDRTSPLPRLPPTGPKAAVQAVAIPPTGPRGSWQTPISANTASTPTSAGSASGVPSGTPATPTAAPVPPSGPRGPMGPIPVPGMNGRGGGAGFGGNMRFFEARGAWRGRGMGRGHHIPHGARGR